MDKVAFKVTVTDSDLEDFATVFITEAGEQGTRVDAFIPRGQSPHEVFALLLIAATGLAEVHHLVKLRAMLMELEERFSATPPWED